VFYPPTTSDKKRRRREPVLLGPGFSSRSDGLRGINALFGRSEPRRGGPRRQETLKREVPARVGEETFPIRYHHRGQPGATLAVGYVFTPRAAEGADANKSWSSKRSYFSRC